MHSPPMAMDAKCALPCRAAVEHFERNFRLCVLDAIQQLQRCTEKPQLGVDSWRIAKFLKTRTYVDGDIESQVETALRALCDDGYVEATDQAGYLIALHLVSTGPNGQIDDAQTD